MKTLAQTPKGQITVGRKDFPILGWRAFVRSGKFTDLQAAWDSCPRGAYAYAADAAAAAAYAARTKMRQRCADIVRKHYPQIP